MTHRRAVAMMVTAALMWSIAGVVTRHLDAARSFEVTFWRSAFNALALLLFLGWWRGPVALRRSIVAGGQALWLSALCWCVMFTAFMVALTLTTVANVLITMAIAPLLTALAARLFLGHRLMPRTWMAIAAAGIGIGAMYGSEVALSGAAQLLGVLVAAAVPVAAAANWTLMQHLQLAGTDGRKAAGDMLPAVLLGAAMSALLTAPLALPFTATSRDLALLGLLGVVQLAIPCLLAMRAAQVLKAPEVSLLALLEVVFGVAWAWLGAGEAPSATVLGGGALVLAALVANEATGLRQRRSSSA